MGFTALIVDDETIPRAILQQHLPWEKLGVTKVLLASDGEEALAEARRCPPDLVVSDIKMPRKNGLEMAAELRKFCPGCKFIFLSGYSDKEYLKGAIKLKAASYVEKPIDLEEITAALRDAISELGQQLPHDPRMFFFRGEAGGDTPLNDHVFLCSKSQLSEIGTAIRHKKKAETELALQRMYCEISRCEGTDPEYLRHLYCQLVFLFLTAAESHNITTVTQRTDFLLYTAAKQNTLAQLWDALYQTARDYFAALDPQDRDVTARVDHYLEQHSQNRTFTVQEMASELGFVNTYLCAAYKKSCGKTINQRLTELRIQHAKQLLTGPPQKLYEIARAVGYSDGKYFVKLFTRETGLSPKAYRERHCHEE